MTSSYMKFMRHLYQWPKIVFRFGYQVHCWSPQAWWGLYPQNSKYVVGFHGLWVSTNRIDIDIFSSPDFHQFRETLDACMKDLRASSSLSYSIICIHEWTWFARVTSTPQECSSHWYLVSSITYASILEQVPGRFSSINLTVVRKLGKQWRSMPVLVNKG